MFVVTVVFGIKPDHLDAFLPLMRENARRSLDAEPGCQRFDVCQDPSQPYEVFLYEVYDDAAAFDAHLAAPHFLEFSAAVEPMVESKAVKTLTLLDA